MIVEKRTYSLEVGAAPEFLALYESEGLQLAISVLGKPVGFYTTEVGTLNQVVHMWAFDSLDDRQRLRAELTAIPEWQRFVVKLRPLIKHQENTILVPAPFFLSLPEED